jgi:hypothetical protein
MIQCDTVAIHLPDKESSALRLVALDSHGHASMSEEDNDGHEGKNSGEEIYEAFRSRKPILSPEKAECRLPLISRNRV